MKTLTYSDSNDVHDFIALGIGPFNLGLAALSKPIPGLKCLFLDQRPSFNWHPGLMLEGVHLQTPFLSDLVTLADPTHPLSFLNYIKQRGRIYSFYIREDFFLLRQEYNLYCQWAASQLDTLRWNTRVLSINFSAHENCYLINSINTESAEPVVYKAKKLVLGTGPAPWVPKCCDALFQTEGAHTVTHAGDYLSHKPALMKKKRITVLGSGQSAAEIFYDALQSIDQHHYKLDWITSSPRFFPLEYSKLTLEMTSPEYVDYFYHLPSEKRKSLIDSQKCLYKGINTDLINAIFDLLYVKRLSLEAQSRVLEVQLITNSRLVESEINTDGLTLGFTHSEQQKNFSHKTQGLVLATGYQYQIPEFLTPIQTRIHLDKGSSYAVNRNYSIDRTGNEIFVQNAELHTHGFVTPDLGMACYRNAYILREITGVEHYSIESKIAFQHFGVPTTSHASTHTPQRQTSTTIMESF